MPEPKTKTKSELEAEVNRLNHRVNELRELGDALWYCLRHRHAISNEEVIDATIEWSEGRDDVR